MAENETDEEREAREAAEKKEADAKSEELGEAGKRALDAERKARRAAESRLKDIETKLKEAEDAEKSELDRLKGQVDDLKKRAEDAESKADRFEVAAAKGLTLAQARRLVGSTKEELEEDADALRTDLGLKDESDDDESKGEKKDETKGPGRPREQLKPGASNEPDDEPDAGKLADSILSDF